MAQDICKKLHQIEKDIFSLREIGSLEKLHDRASNILTQISIQKSLDEIVELLRGGKSLPVRRIGFNIKKLCDGTEESNSRWQRLQALDLDAFILCTVSFPRIASLPAEQFTWLVNNANRYLEAQALPPNWIRSDQVRKVLANTPRKENTVQFLEDYYKFEIRPWDEDGSSNVLSRKRSRTESTPEPSPSKRAHVEDESTSSTQPLTMPFTVDAANVILEHLRDGCNNELTISFPKPQVHPPYLIIPYYLCSTIMETYGVYRSHA